MIQVVEHYGILTRTPFDGRRGPSRHFASRLGLHGHPLPLRIGQRLGLPDEPALEGIIARLEKNETTSERTERASCAMTDLPCPSCHVEFNPARSVTVGGLRLPEISMAAVHEALALVRAWWPDAEAGPPEAWADSAEVLDERSLFIGREILKEIESRLSFLDSVGLDYLTLDRRANTLSGGESQRIRLATQIGSRLTGVMYVLDEPSIGLHQRDNERLLETLRELSDLGNTLVVVEHDEDTLRQADWLCDLGPGAGLEGGPSWPTVHPRRSWPRKGR